MSALAERFNVLRYPMEEKLMEAFLTVRDSMPEDSGQYQCRAGPQVSPPAPVLVKGEYCLWHQLGCQGLADRLGKYGSDSSLL